MSKGGDSENTQKIKCLNTVMILTIDIANIISMW